MTESRWRWQSNRFVTLKVLTSHASQITTANTELELSKCIATTNPKNRGLRYLRTVLSSFELAGPSSAHLVLVYALMRESLTKFQRRLADCRLPSDVMKSLLEMLLAGLDYLHSECHIIHTGTSSR